MAYDDTKYKYEPAPRPVDRFLMWTKLLRALPWPVTRLKKVLRSIWTRDSDHSVTDITLAGIYFYPLLAIAVACYATNLQSGGAALWPAFAWISLFPYLLGIQATCKE